MTATFDAVLALADGTVFTGSGFGARTTVSGEICFNTGMTGYQEVLTDPSYHGQIVAMTAPQIGNTGVNDFDDQSRRPWVEGFVVRDLTERPSSWRAESPLSAYLERHGVPGITDVDTRRLTRHVRSAGAMPAVLSTEGLSVDETVDRARTAPSLVGRDLVAGVSTEQTYRWGPDQLEGRVAAGFAAGSESSPTTASLMERNGDVLRIAAYDFGVKQNILDLLASSGFDVDVVPATTPAEHVTDGEYSGVFLSNGPGDPEAVTYAVDAVRSMLGRVPVFGICLGHQLLALALGAHTFKLPFGHRGANHPVKQTDDAHVEVTCQNHGFAVDEDSLATTPARLTHVNLNDGTVEGLAVPGIAFSVQYHPESGPGPHDSRYLFGRFRKLIDTFEPGPVPGLVRT